MSTVSFIRTAEEISSAWLAAVLERPALEVIGTERIGTGQMSQNHRVTFTVDGEGPGSVVVKLASADPMSRATGVGMRAYYREIAFYRNLGARIGTPVPDCHLASYDEADGWFTLVLEDVVGAVQGDQIAGCTADEARVALRELARLHAPVLGDLAVGAAEWLNLPSPLDQQLLTQLLPGFLNRYEDRVAPEHANVCERFIPVLDAWAADRRPPLGLVHGDYRLDNLLFAGGTCKVVDWQTVTWGPAMLDATYFISGGLSVEDRRTHEEALVRLYHNELLEHGAQGFPWGRCWEEYRRQTFHGILMTVAASMVVERTERGDDMFMTWLERNAQQVLDLDALSLLPEPSASKPSALRPATEDEGRHSPGPEASWNESWYFDAVSDAGDLGLYARIGRVPNQGVALYTAAICRPGGPAVMVVDANAPLPAIDDDAQIIDGGGIYAEHHCEESLVRFHVVLRGEGQVMRTSPLRYVGRRASRSTSSSISSGRPTEFPTPGGSRHATRSRAASPVPCASATKRSHSPGRVSATIRGARGTGGPRTGCGTRCISRTARTHTRWAFPRCLGSVSDTSSATAS